MTWLLALLPRRRRVRPDGEPLTGNTIATAHHVDTQPIVRQTVQLRMPRTDVVNNRPALRLRAFDPLQHPPLDVTIHAAHRPRRDQLGPIFTTTAGAT